MPPKDAADGRAVPENAAKQAVAANSTAYERASAI
jgi:hypothetical protein